jgi:penicillin amidase
MAFCRVPGDGRFEWQGRHSPDILPIEFNPERGFVATANSNPLPPDFPLETYPISFEWAEPWRTQRIFEVLSSQPRHSLADSGTLQTDERSLFANEVINRLPPSATGPAARMLRDWDRTLSAESAAAALFVIWIEEHLKPKLRSILLPGHAALLHGIDQRSILDFMDQTRSEPIILEALDAAYRDATARFGPDTGEWAWGRMHRTAFAHPLRAQAGGALATAMAMPQFQMGGSGDTTNNTMYFDSRYNVDLGGAYRQVIDVGNWDASTMTNAPGQSGHPGSPFYSNMLAGWARGERFPLLFSRDRIEANRVMTIRLVPGQNPGAKLQGTED